MTRMTTARVGLGISALCALALGLDAQFIPYVAISLAIGLVTTKG